MSCRVTILQTNIKWADPDANQKALESALLSSEKSDLYVLPEMWNTGFMASQESFFTLNSSLFTLKELALRFDAAIAGSMDVEEEGKRYNRFYFVTPTDIYYYDKHHLFSYAGEDKSFTAGEGQTIVEWRGVRFLLQVCYDLRFPCFSRNSLSADGTPLYDAIIYVANWPASRRKVWDVLLQARAIEDQCFVIGVNRVGDDPNCHYDGGSAIIDAKGKILARVQDDTVASATALLDMDSLNTFREKFPVLRDADK